jgi:CspA family cold shock protein
MTGISQKIKREPLTNNAMKTGTVKFFNSMRGFGFITVDGTGEEIFAHKSDIKGTIRENDKVEFEIQKGQKGLNAVNVKVI